MSLDRDEKILHLIAKLSNDVLTAREYSLDHTAHLLQMAQLELQMILHGISDEELRAINTALAQTVG